MKHSSNNDTIPSNIYQAFQRNKIIQGKLYEREHLYYRELIKNIRTNNSIKQFNRELLYSWRQENYIRHVRKIFYGYEQNDCNVIDINYEYHLRSLERMITNQQSVHIPLSEEKYRSNIKTRFSQFLQDNPIPTTSPMLIIQLDDIEEEKQNKDAPLSPIYSQSPRDFRRQQSNVLPPIQCSSRMNENQFSITTPFDTPRPYTTFEERQQLSSRLSRILPDHMRLLESPQSILLGSDSLQKLTGADLVTMRSIRRPRKHSADLNQTFEARRKLYQTNKRFYDEDVNHRRRGL